jgi:DNA-directed RNA polymerase subunit F
MGNLVWVLYIIVNKAKRASVLSDTLFYNKYIFCIFDLKITIMDLQTKKINFVQEFLRVKSEELVDKLEKLLKSERMKQYEKDLTPMTSSELNDIIDNAEYDSFHGRLTSAIDLKKEVDSWK